MPNPFCDRAIGSRVFGQSIASSRTGTIASSTPIIDERVPKQVYRYNVNAIIQLHAPPARGYAMKLQVLGIYIYVDSPSKIGSGGLSDYGSSSTHVRASITLITFLMV
ncbi:hypothetical protein TWF102_004558 [Orbilia oligospora]|uniref:Uncharacterized protein n=1 Tax=Orbilia oligospora TaxID=2813651 RepID=A0A7C8NI16_ORBOL|nr:hypothetical protein TWF103_008087 [Orbilia oligospora]KAF3101248.1 hypothetical protein TWF706_005559 [Orbilia oligospora]KAF3102351.1 hypothetical protein TWF102_004558 [Orbilia oligospora]